MFGTILRSKPSVAAAIVLVLLIPLSMIESKISERQTFRWSATEEVSRSWSNPQSVVGPVLVVEYEVTEQETAWLDKEGKFVSRFRSNKRNAFLPMEALTVLSSVETERRYRGLYHVPVYITDIDMQGAFEPSRYLDLAAREDLKAIHRAYLWIHVSDQRGFANVPTLEWGADSIPFSAGGHPNLGDKGIVAELNLDALKKESKFKLSFGLRGTRSLSFVPTGYVTKVEISSLWQHPKFAGQFLPENRTIDD